MSGKTFRIIGIGEVLWDLLPSGSTPGGAPANVIYHVNALGDRGRMVTRVGDDPRGREMLSHLRAVGIDTGLVQIDPSHPTGTATVSLEGGQPSYTFPENAAWDFVEWNDDVEQCAAEADAVVFGTLAQRHGVTRTTVHRFLDAVRPEVLRVYDVNLRPPYDDMEIVQLSLRKADVVKMNEEECMTILPVCGCNATDSLLNDARCLREAIGCSLVCVTRGERGSVLVTKDDADEQHGQKTDVVDTVGAGDAYTAALIHFFLRGVPLRDVHTAATTLGTWVATKEGAMPEYDDDISSQLP